MERWPSAKPSSARPEALAALESQHFDYVVIDEVHHAQAPSYRRVMARLNATFTPLRHGTAAADSAGRESRLLLSLGSMGLSTFHFYAATGDDVPGETTYARLPRGFLFTLLTTALCFFPAGVSGDEKDGLRLERDGHWLVILGDHLPEGEIRINYLEAYCRGGSTDADWSKHTVIPHQKEFLSLNEEKTEMKLRDTLEDGVVVDHFVSAGRDEVTFELTARNPGGEASEVQWAQPCVRLGAFTGFHPDHREGDIDDYLPKCFLFIEGELKRMPTAVWATRARYTPGQVWVPGGVPRTDVNPRPLNPQVPSNGLIGCFSGDESLVFATAWEPYQELFQGVARCLHSDFRIGGLDAGETRKIRGKIYLTKNDIPALLERYRADFPEHHAGD